MRSETELKQQRRELAALTMQLEDALYEDCENEELRADLQDAQEDYAYVCSLLEKHYNY